METENNAWSGITASLNALQDQTLTSVLADSLLGYDGNYVIQAPASAYTTLCAYFPLIETVVQDQTGKHFRLNLEPSVPMGTDSVTMRMQLGASNLTEAILNPEAIVAVPSYLLRFVPFVGSAPILIATALRQAFYFASRHSGASQLYPISGSEVTIDVQSILTMLGGSISRAKFFRIFKSGQMDWFVTRAEAAHQFVDGKIRRLPNTYFYQGQVLTPGDADDLGAWLLKNGFDNDPLGTLDAALRGPRSEIFRFPYRLPARGEPSGAAQVRSVRQVVSQLLNQRRLEPALSALCDRLSSHLIRPESFLAVPWYWFKNVLPELGDDLGMLYLMAKNCCYIDWARGQDRDRFWVAGGLESLQAWIGSETLPKRIPHERKSRRGRPRNEEIAPESQYTRDWRESNRDLAGQYLLRTATRKNDAASDWQLRVFDVHLTARDETLRQALAAFLHSLPEPLNEESLSVFAENSLFQSLMLAQSKAHPSRLCHFETLVNEGLCQNETLDGAAICHFDTLADALNCYFETLVTAGICQFDTIIKILIKIKNSLLITENSRPTKSPDGRQDPESQADGETELMDGWDFEDLTREVNPVISKSISDQKLELAFVSWLIQASLSPGVRSPLNLAVSRCLETRMPASQPSQRLARTMPTDLRNALRVSIHRLESGQSGRYAFGGEIGRDLIELMQGAEDLATQKRLARRLLDGIS